MSAKSRKNSKMVTDKKADDIQALLSELTRSLAGLSAVVDHGNAATSARLDRLEGMLDQQFAAIAEDVADQSATIEVVGDNVVLLAAALANAERDAKAERQSLSNIERRLGGIELGLDSLNRRSENDTRDLLRRVVALEASGR